MGEDVKGNCGWNKDMAMPLREKIRADLKQAMLNKENAARDTLRQIMSEYPKLTVPITLESGKKTTRLKKPEEISDDDVLGIIRGLVKSEKTVLELKNEETSAYLAMLELYLPKMVTKEEIMAWIEENIDISQFKSPMQAMGPIMKHFGQQADGSMVKSLLQEMIGS